MVRARPTQLVCAIVAVLIVAGCSSTPESGSDTGGSVGIVPKADRFPIKDSLEARLVEIGDRIFFEYDKAELRPEGRELVQKWASFLAQYPAAKVTIEGHCDERGTREYNLALGERRAEAAKSYLVLIGADERRVSVISYGKERPSVLGSTDKAWAQNRRAVMVVE
jgi:peptidoglycan-associated lipoprotein